MHIRVTRSESDGIIGSLELENYQGGNAHHFDLPCGPVVFAYIWANIDSDGNVLRYIEEYGVLESPRIEIMLDVRDFKHPEQLPGWKPEAPRRIIDVGFLL